MSFALTVKEEIVSKTFQPSHKQALLCGFIKHNGQFLFSNNEPKLKLEMISNKIARTILTLCKEYFAGDIQISIIQSQGLKKNKIYQLILIGEIDEFLERLNIFKGGVKIIELSAEQISDVKALRAYIAGIFIATGSVNSPTTTNYHLELQFKDLPSATYFAALSDTFDFDFKLLKRNEDKYLCYIKKSLLISDFIKLIGAPQSVMEFENQRIHRDVLNSFNRINNIDIANDKKTITSGLRQVDQINKIIENRNLYKLSDKAKMLVNLRIENQDASYIQLQEMMNELGVMITKSGISNLFKIIQKMSEEN